MGIIINSSNEREKAKKLLTKKFPSYRQAYSDRTSWIMACLSELVYLKFNPFFSEAKYKEYFVNAVNKLVKKEKPSSLIKLNAVSLTESFVFKEKAFLFNSMPSGEFPVWTH